MSNTCTWAGRPGEAGGRNTEVTAGQVRLTKSATTEDVNERQQLQAEVADMTEVL